MNATYINHLPEIKTSVENICGASHVYMDEESLYIYSRDQTEQLSFLPVMVVKPGSAEEISTILKLCNQYKMPVTPRGAGTGLSGGALPLRGGMVISTERLNQIIKIDEDNFQVITQPGVITEVLQNAVAEKGLFFPPDPASKGSCFVGGNIAENSGGPKAVKYGVVKDYVLNLQVVLPTGEIIYTGANVLKNATGYNLTQLITGSEGTLGIITEIVLKLIPLPAYDLLMMVPFKKLTEAGTAVNAILKKGIIPSALELIEKAAMDIVCKMTGSKIFSGIEDVEAFLLIEVDGNIESVLMQEMEMIAELMSQFQTLEILFAADASQKESLWHVRRKLAEAVKIEGYTIEEDTVVPRAFLPDLILAVKQLGLKHNFKSVCYGHAGDGNLHIRIKKPGIKNSYGNEEMNNIISELFKTVQSLDGTLSAEHGIGLIQKSFMPIVFDEKSLEIMQKIKAIFDPNNILNPGKIFP